jgi:hypothetical protein
MEEVKTKKCACCGEVKPIDAFHLVKKGQDKRRNRCKSCMSKEAATWKKENPERRKQLDKKYYKSNKEKIRVSKKQWKAENADKIQTAWAAYYAVNKDSIQERSSKWAKENREQDRAHKRKYIQNNKPKYAYYQSVRRARKLDATPAWLTALDLHNIEIEYKLAAWCSEVMGEEYHVDHIVPLQGKKVSGLHVPWNLRVIPASKNISKSNKFNPEEGMSMPAM